MRTEPRPSTKLRGVITAGAVFAALMDWFDDAFARLATRHQAVQHRYPPILARDTLRMASWFENFPDVAMPVMEGTAYLAPAVCFHTWPLLTGPHERLPIVITARGDCFRNEARFSSHPSRLLAFSMREIVFADTPAQVASRRKRLSEAAIKLAREIGIEAHLELGNDPFFAGVDGRSIMQTLKEVKLELRASGTHGETMALASFNLHEDFFTSRFGITSPGGPLHSGCAAFGLERWTDAFLAAHPDELLWPARIRRALAGRMRR